MRPIKSFYPRIAGCPNNFFRESLFFQKKDRRNFYEKIREIKLRYVRDEKKL